MSKAGLIRVVLDVAGSVAGEAGLVVREEGVVEPARVQVIEMKPSQNGWSHTCGLSSVRVGMLAPISGSITKVTAAS